MPGLGLRLGMPGLRSGVVIVAVAGIPGLRLRSGVIVVAWAGVPGLRLWAGVIIVAVAGIPGLRLRTGVVIVAWAGVPRLRLRNGGLRYIVTAMIAAVAAKIGIGLGVVSAMVAKTGMLAVPSLIIMALLETAMERTFQRVHGVQNFADALVEAGLSREQRG